MVKTLLSVILTLFLLVGAGVGEHFFVTNRFDKLAAAVDALYQKTQDREATQADADAVNTLWKSEKKDMSPLTASPW